MKKLRDAFHLWTGEVNGLDYFLTIDKRFINAMTKSRKNNLLCNPVAPDDLLGKLNILEKDPFPVKPGQFYDFFGKPG